MILSDMRKGMSEACKYSVGWHALLFPSMRGMGGEQKFLLFVCVCTLSMCIPETRKKLILVKVKNILGSLDFRSPSDVQMSFDNISRTLVLL